MQHEQGGQAVLHVEHVDPQFGMLGTEHGELNPKL